MSNSAGSDSSSDSSTGSEIEEIFLRASRNGDLKTINLLLEKRDFGKYAFDISCKGKSKSNLGWTPLHLATYFGHRNVMEVLLDAGADINAINDDDGDTPLHKAAFIGREDLVMLLLQHNADVNSINGEGRLPRNMTPSNEMGKEISKLLRAAEATEMLREESKLLTASRDGDIESLKILLKDQQSPNINCVDAQGNSCLHCAAYRGHKETAVLLLQNGIDTNIRNNRGQLALDLARDAQTMQVLGVKAVRRVQKTATQFEGSLLKRSRFLGWKPVWAVLERGVLTYFGSRADSKITENKRKDYKYLDSARVTPLTTDLSSFVVHFNDGAVHRLSVINNGEISPQVERQKWINALHEHAAYSSHYLWGLEKRKSDSDDDYGAVAKPLGCMADALSSATASYEVLQRQLGECATIVEALQKTLDVQDISSNLPTTSMMRFQLVSETAANMVASLEHCLTLFHQQEDIRVLQLKQEQEKCRVLEESLNVLAKEHHALEQSVASHISESGGILNPKSPRIYDTDDDEYYDAFEQDSDNDTLVTADSLFNSPTESLQDLNSISVQSYEPLLQSKTDETAAYNRLQIRKQSTDSNSSSGSSGTLVDCALSMSMSLASTASSCGTLVSEGGGEYRCARNDFSFQKINLAVEIFHRRTSLPAPMFSRNDFSIWSVLKNCIGKELSKITMPVIFNEPLSFLQRMCEYMEYAKLIRVASEQNDPVDRLKYIAGFAVSALASNVERFGKPFNPLIGETYELQRPEYRVVCEQVSHHPPISAFHADSPNFVFHGSIHPKLKFWGKSVEIQPKGMVTIELPKWDESYTWSNVNCCVHNIIVGKLWMEQYGTMEVVNHNTGHRAVLTFKPAGWASKDLHRVEGFITDKNKKKLFFLYGKWTEFIKCSEFEAYNEYMKENAHKFRKGDERTKSPNESPIHTPRKVFSKLNSLKMSSFKSLSMQESEDIPEPIEGDIPKCDSTYSIDIPNSFTLWEAEQRPPNTADYYQFTLFAMSLNEMEPGMKPPLTLCPTDSRLRPDIRKLEAGDMDGAAAEKTRLEEKQRDARKSRKGKKNDEWTPRWFSLRSNPHTKQADWLYAGGYWDRKYEMDGEISIF